MPPTDFCWIPNRREVEADAGDFELILVRRAPKIWVKEDGRARPAGRVRDPVSDSNRRSPCIRRSMFNPDARATWLLTEVDPD